MSKNKLWGAPLRLFLIVSIVALGFTGCSDMGNEEPLSPQAQQEMMILGKDNPGIKRAMEVQQRFTASLMADEDVIGTGTGVTAEGTPAVIVFKNRGTSAHLPSVLEGVPVEQRVVGEIVAYQYIPNAKGGNPGGPGGGSSGPNPRDRFVKPVPIGVSTGNYNECASGTIGCRVKNANGDVFALSNNHVFARMNAASLGESQVQPGRYDVNCGLFSADIFATLFAFQTIVFSTSANNTMDAAIASTTTANLGNATPSNGYGMPSSTPVAAGLNMSVQKYGRTTGQTAGYVSAINATVNVGYPAGTARFVGQIVIANTSRRSKFSDSGDSGSLIVTNDSNANPVALLFAGSNTATIGNPIQAVLSHFNVTVDGK